jgi:hypothetical protein
VKQSYYQIPERDRGGTGYSHKELLENEEIHHRVEGPIQIGNRPVVKTRKRVEGA